MKRVVVGLMLTLALPTWAADDAPFVAPAGLTCIPDAQRINEGRVVLAQTVQIEKLEKRVMESTPLHPVVVVLIVVGAAAAGAAVTAGVMSAKQ